MDKNIIYRSAVPVKSLTTACRAHTLNGCKKHQHRNTVAEHFVCFKYFHKNCMEQIHHGKAEHSQHNPCGQHISSLTEAAWRYCHQKIGSKIPHPVRPVIYRPLDSLPDHCKHIMRCHPRLMTITPNRIVVSAGIIIPGQP
mgnify:CR=1 FL=1